MIVRQLRKDDGVELADILTKGSWAHVVPLGPIVIETCTLTFRADGHVQEEIGDDTGLQDSDGTWALERTDDGDVLRLLDELRYHGRFSIKYLEKEKAFDLRIGSGSRSDPETVSTVFWLSRNRNR